ncbi:NAD(P)-binding protein [Plastoroseomonas arctica]|uniref:NAD(P)-binding protein n=1 Tax=Plastoroseomonas arctica TaxID=1509237 RepID=A0AAF1JZ54_9PROT|nr:NAD(P)-binding protein [Plastoroseomonas arctica]MBR0653675.1 NAD(P)-binding protein [Plastoroseomonas arctica]
MTALLADFTPTIDLLRQKGTGPARTKHPEWVALLPPCNAACPAGEDIQAWLDLAQAGKFREAWEVILRDNPFPAVHGRVCYHPCETGCNRAQLDSAVSIHAVERFLGDMASAQGWVPRITAAPSGKRVLVIGAGPSGMAAAYHLARAGHTVEIRDAGPLPGGMLHFGIPAYRLPREELMKEVRRIEAMGVTITVNHKVTDLLAEQAEGRFDAVFIAIGTQIGKRIDIPARDAAKVFTAINLLHDAAAGTAPKLGRRVVVYGAGNTAMDAARTARRLGAEEAMIVFISDRAHMEAHAFEAQEALDEGIKIHWLSSIHDIGAGAITVERMALDAEGRAQPTGEMETLAADSVVLALGQKADTGFLGAIPGMVIGADGNVQVDAGMMTGHAGVFAGGDMVSGDRSVTAAVGGGKKAARHIDAWLRGVTVAAQPPRTGISFDMLHLPIYADAPLATQHELPVGARMGASFVETTDGLAEPAARHEAQRCLSCGNCYECDQCFASCPEQAIVKLAHGAGYDVDLDHCTGCAICFEQCPCHAIDMVQEAHA